MWLVLAGLIATGCSSSDSSNTAATGIAGSGGAGAGTGGTGGGGSKGGTGGSGSGGGSGSSGSGGGSSGGSSGSSGSSGSGGAPVDCDPVTPCGPSDYCDHGGNGCDAKGTCLPRPATCAPGCPAPQYQPCGCDGQLYCNSCVAKLNGTDLSGQQGKCGGAGAGGAGGATNYCDQPSTQCAGTSTPEGCDQCCYAAYPGGDLSLVAYSCACTAGGPCAGACASSKICNGGMKYDSAACVECFKQQELPGGACAKDASFQSNCCGSTACGGLAACLRSCPLRARTMRIHGVR